MFYLVIMATFHVPDRICLWVIMQCQVISFVQSVVLVSHLYAFPGCKCKEKLLLRIINLEVLFKVMHVQHVCILFITDYEDLSWISIISLPMKYLLKFGLLTLQRRKMQHATSCSNIFRTVLSWTIKPKTRGDGHR